MRPLFIKLHSAGHGSQKLQNKETRFGCRLLAVLKQDTVDFRHHLKEAPNALKHQSKPGRCEKTGHPEGFNQPFFERGNPHGWGIARYEKPGALPERSRNFLSAEHDPAFDQAADIGRTTGKLQPPKNESPEAQTPPTKAQKPQTVSQFTGPALAHIRLAYPYNVIRTENNHPFIHANWAFVHNGFADGVQSVEIQEKLDKTWLPTLGAKLEGTTDSEKFFFAFLGKLQEKQGGLDSKAIGAETVGKIFLETVAGISAKASGAEITLDDGKKLQAHPAYNAIFSDGVNLYAFRKGHPLYFKYSGPASLDSTVASAISVSTSALSDNVVLASEPTDSGCDPALKGWQDIPENTLMIFSPGKPPVSLPGV